MSINLSKNKAIVRSYSTALFELAIEKSEENIIFDQLKIVSKIISSQKKLLAILIAPTTNYAIKDSLIQTLADELKFTDLTINFLKLLAKNRRINLLNEISASYFGLLQAHKNIKMIKLISAFPLNSSDLKDIQNSLESRFNSSVILENMIEESIIGGMIIKYDSIMEDYSVVNALKNIELTTKNISIYNS